MGVRDEVLDRVAHTALPTGTAPICTDRFGLPWMLDHTGAEAFQHTGAEAFQQGE